MGVTEVNNINWKNRLVRSNDFTGASYSLLPDAHRIISVAVSVINKDDLDFTTCRIYTKKLIEYYPSLKNDKNSLARLDEATDSLMWSFVKIELKDGWIKRNLVESCQFSKNHWNPYIDIRLSDDMLPYFISVTSKFSAPRMANTQLLKKDHHFKLHGFFHSLSYKKEPTYISVEELRNIFDIDKKQYKLVGHFKNRLLMPTIEYINKVTDLTVKCFDVKQWRKIIGFKFIVTVNEAKLPKERSGQVLWELNLSSSVAWKPNDTISENHKKTTDQFTEWWLKANELTKLTSCHGQDYIDQLTIYIHHKIKTEKIISIKNYIFGVLKNKPTINDLQTPQCFTKGDELKKQKQLKNEQNKQEHIDAVNIQQAALKQQQVLKYLAQLTPEEVSELKQTFNDSKAASGLKFWQESVDFDRPLVKATFEYYVYSKCLHNAE